MVARAGRSGLGRRPDERVAVGVLMIGAADPLEHPRIVGVGRAVAGKRGQAGIPRDATFVAVLNHRRGEVGSVETADENADVVAFRVIERQRRAAGAAEPAASDVGAGEEAERAARDAE